MDESKRIEGWFEDGTLVRPCSGASTIVDLARAVLAAAGVDDPLLEEAPGDLRDRLVDREHLVFILIDALGSELLADAAPGSFLAGHRTGELLSVFPSTTAAALTSFATGQYPARHGIPGWWVYLEDQDLTATVLPYQERFSDLDLRELGVQPEAVFPQPSLLPRADRSVLTVTPQAFLRDVYLHYSTGGGPAGGYEDPRQAFQRVVEHVMSASGPTYTSVYLPQVDEACHRKGVDSTEVKSTLASLDTLVGWLHEQLEDQARIVVTGDHGHVPLPPDRVLLLDEGDPVMEALVCPPTGEPTVPFFHVKSEFLDEFGGAFAERFGDAFTLLPAAEVERLELMGPAPLSSATRARIGDFVGIAPQPTALHYRPRGTRVTPNLGVHAGLTRGEMSVPLIIV